MKSSSLYENTGSTDNEYVDIDSPIHRIDPVTKLCYGMCVVFIASVFQQVRFPFFCFLISILILLCAGVFRKMLPAFGITTVALVVAVIIMGLFDFEGQASGFKILGLTFYYGSLINGVMISLSVYNTIGVIGILMLTTEPEHLTRMGMPQKLYHFLMPMFQTVPGKLPEKMPQRLFGDTPENIAEDESFIDDRKYFYPHAWLMRLGLGVVAVFSALYAVLY